MSIGYFQWTKIGCFRWTRSGCFRRTLTLVNVSAPTEISLIYYLYVATYFINEMEGAK